MVYTAIPRATSTLDVETEYTSGILPVSSLGKSTWVPLAVICAETELYYVTLGAKGAEITDYDYSQVS
jgi:hypothetical protein